MKRGYIPYPEKLASLLGPKIGVDYETLKTMTAEEINARFDWDHYPIRKVDGGPDVHWNIFPRLRADHREKTAKVDLPEAAKSRRLETKWGPFKLAVAEGRKPPQRRSRWPKRPFNRSKKWRKV